jgi:predicted enzyme related to lactoylglutathione lyase
MPNAVTQFQILSKKPDETAKFYAELFGWSVNASNPSEYRQINTGSEVGIQEGIWPAPSDAPNFVQLFVSVEDVKALVRKARELGAKAAIPPTMLPQGDEMAVVIDPQGMSFGVWKLAKVPANS